MAIEKIQCASEVLDTFMGEQAQDDSLDQVTIAVIAGLRGDDKLTRTNLLRKLDEARKAALKDGDRQREGGS
ncbi:hypothetical protein JQX09_18580 [Sulfitobacter pseudonitzschiae]|uniref:Uncharacterized protein n=1 Tax=Pseudosulfitobacter pseudonitzschiae TaxID=1402135 RepID=A0A9Q2P407_9RHOB|nr:hypothetical protein [Pseudosulfitobacter pseudonitzschiae]MBM2293999.1 hypothetical protein [Pseudosulfitobacter pseudonitzschiae]MBM2298854.1 hypothetical protein [Pseudosulfitobacter pseudonitzschiae]MBM2303768.1 hypothetical protein [Pseudosulfitobacter pseudonitzschiae]MBM2313613.1 hypothetical protein [Pseudosulfitobacter pseudonitzschiae]MBM2318465.1 hypothetical protein [Pseudosulfitobacter pseudonitzschiae]